MALGMGHQGGRSRGCGTSATTGGCDTSATAEGCGISAISQGGGGSVAVLLHLRVVKLLPFRESEGPIHQVG